MSQYEKYGELAKSNSNATVQNGRYPIQATAEKRVFADVVDKLQITAQSTLLDIGCGAGNILVPSSFICSQAVGIDHPDVIKGLANRITKDNIQLLSGNFLQLEFSHPFDRIIAYSVLHTLEDQKQIFAFVEKVISTLNPDGVALLGDIPNNDKKRRFIASKRGETFQRQWETALANNTEPHQLDKLRVDRVLTTDDRFFSELILFIRSFGFETNWLPQKATLPFGNTREDIVIYGPEYEQP